MTYATEDPTISRARISAMICWRFMDVYSRLPYKKGPASDRPRVDGPPE